MIHSVFQYIPTQSLLIPTGFRLGTIIHTYFIYKTLDLLCKLWKINLAGLFKIEGSISELCWTAALVYHGRASIVVPYQRIDKENKKWANE